MFKSSMRYWAIAAALLSLAGCAQPRDSQLRRALEYVKDTANPPVNRINYGRCMALLVNVEDVGLVQGVVNTALASLPDNSTMPSIFAHEARQPWCVVVKEGLDGRHVLVEGYGESLTTPLFAENIDVMELDREKLDRAAGYSGD